MQNMKNVLEQIKQGETKCLENCINNNDNE